MSGIAELNASPSRSFTDAAGTLYRPRIDVRALVKFETQTGVCLLNAGPDPFQGKLTNLMRLAFLACDEQVTQAGRDFDTFCAAFTSETLTRGLSEATAGALADFFQSRTGN